MFLFDPDQEHLTSLVAWEHVFGRRDWCWEELKELGLSLHREEAREYLAGENPPLLAGREALYELLFDKHPELELSVFSPQEWLKRIERKDREVPESISDGVDAAQLPVEVDHDAEDSTPNENAIIFRLGDNGPGGMNQQDTVETALLAADQDELWIPIDSKVNFGLDKKLQAVEGNLYLAFGDHLVLHVIVDECLHDISQRSDYPGKLNPWPIDQSYGWVRVSQSREVEIGPKGFLVRHGDAWDHGYVNQSPLLRAIVNDN